MKISLLLASLCLLAASSLSAQERYLAFDRGGGIFVSDLAGKKPARIARGSWPDISPDGSRVTLNTETKNTPERHISVIERKTGKQTTFSKVPSDNCHSPVWSPDGKQIVFYLFADNDWQVGMVDADGENFRYVKKAGAKNRSFWGACWAPDGKSLYCQDMDAIYRIDLEGKVLRKWVLTDLFGETATFNSGSHLAPSPDGKSLLFDADMNEDVPATMPDWQGPPPAIWQLDFASDKVKRISPAKLFAWQPCWISDDEILFTSMKEGEKKTSLWRQKLDGGNRTLVMKDAWAPSVSR